MVHRDPQTGKFVSGPSGSGECWADFDTVISDNVYRIDAADLSGGNQNKAWEGKTPIVDFGAILEDFDVGELVALQIKSHLSIPTTSTAEAWARAVAQVRSEPGTSSAVGQALVGSTESDEIVDMLQAQSLDNETYHIETLAATNSHSDTTTNVAAGADIAERETLINFRELAGGGPVFDEDDELYLPVQLETDNISDSKVFYEATVQAIVREWDIDNCPFVKRRR